jgi:hypothetical protein
MNYGTVIVDLERRQVIDLLADRSAATTADWFKRHPEIEVVSRDRAGLYADAARQGAPQARQIADRFHLLQNFRETIERQLGRLEAPIRGSEAPVANDQGDCSLIASPLSIAFCLFLVPYRGHGSLRGRKYPPQHLVRSAGAAMSTAGSHV